MMDEVKSWLGVLVALVALGTSVWTWISAGSKKNASEIAAMRDRLETIEDRITIVESRLDNMPEKEQIHRLELMLERLSGRMDTMAATQVATDRTARRVEDFLIKGAA